MVPVTIERTEGCVESNTVAVVVLPVDADVLDRHARAKWPFLPHMVQIEFRAGQIVGL